MANVTISSLILFIASMALAAGVAGTMVTNVSQVGASIDERSIAVSERIESDIDVISDAGSDAVYDGGDEQIVVLVKNTGSTTLPHEADRIDVLVDGEYVPKSRLESTVIVDDSWRAGNVVRLTIDWNLDGGDHRVVVVVNEVREVFRFHT